MRKIYVYLLVVILIFALTISCTKNSDHSQSTESSPQESRISAGFKQAFIELSDDEKDVIEIQTTKAELIPLKSKLSAMGKVLAHPYRKAIVSYAFPGRIAQIHAQIGDWVKAGQELVTLQSKEVGEAKSDFYKAKADYELAMAGCERQKKLFNRGVGAKKYFLSSETELKVAEVNLNAAEKRLHVLGFTEEQVKTIAQTHQISPSISLYSPINGKIISNKAVLGAMIDQSTEILTIMDPTILCIDAEIYEKDIARIRIGQDVDVSVPAYPKEIFMGKIYYISDVLNEETHTITIRTELNNRDYKLKPGMFANIKIILNNQSKALAVPESAVLDDGNDHLVFVQKDGRYFPTIVNTGIRENGHVEILSGIQEGDKVVTNGAFQLKSKLYDKILKEGHVH